MLILDTVFDDCSKFADHLVPIVPYNHKLHDMQLVRLSNYLNRLFYEPHLVRYNAKHFRLSKVQLADSLKHAVDAMVGSI